MWDSRVRNGARMGEAVGIRKMWGMQMEVSRKASWRSEASGSRDRGTHGPAEEGRGARG